MEFNSNELTESESSIPEIPDAFRKNVWHWFTTFRAYSTDEEQGKEEHSPIRYEPSCEKRSFIRDALKMTSKKQFTFEGKLIMII